MRSFLIVSLFASMLMITSCTPDDDQDIKPPAGTEEQFMVLQLSDNNKLEMGAQLSLLKVKNGEPTYKTLNGLYPVTNLRSNVEINNNVAIIGLHTDFNVPGTNRQTNGAWFNIADGAYENLPLLPAGQGRYSYFLAGTEKVSKSGHVFYLSASNVADYHDQYRASLVRYNPKTRKLDTALDPASFAVNQPEKGWDTETGQFTKVFYPSSDGRYVYGAIETFGVNGGSIHWDYKILFKYDFDLNVYTRLGGTEDNNVFVLGITSDGNSLFYQNAPDRKVVNVNSNTINKLTISGGQGYANTSRWNSFSYCSGETNNTIGIYNIVSDVKQILKTSSYPEYAQFSADGKKIYFMIESSKGKYLCRTSDLTSGTVIDTLCTLSSNVNEFMVIK